MVQLDLRGHTAEFAIDSSSFPELKPFERTLAIETWKGRMLNEHASARVFAGLIPQMMAAGICPKKQAEVAEMVAEEYRHARQCAAVVEALGGTPVGELPDLTPLPSHDDADPLEALLRNVLSVCCLSETVAVSLINAERLQLEDNVLGDVLKRILADEVSHARFGWSLLESLSLEPGLRHRLSQYLSVALAALEEHELKHLSPLPPPSESAAEVGVCDGILARKIFFQTVNQVILPRLAVHGLEPIPS